MAFMSGTGTINASLGSRIQKTKRKIDLCLTRRLRENGLTVGVEQVSILVTIYHNPRMSQTGIASLGQKDKSGVTKMLDALERDGLINRERTAGDRRQILVSLSESGKALSERLVRLLEELNAELCDPLSARERETAARALDRIADRADEILSV